MDSTSWAYRLSDELDTRARALSLPLGMTVAVAVLQLLDQDDVAVVATVERAEDARTQDARRARQSARAAPA